MKKEHIFDINERPEISSRNSTNSLREFKDNEHFWESEFVKLIYEQEALSAGYNQALIMVAELRKENTGLKEHSDIIFKDNELEKHEIIKQTAVEILTKIDSVAQEHRRHQKSFKLSICFADSISIQSTSILNRHLIEKYTKAPISHDIKPFRSPENLRPATLERKNQSCKNKLNEFDAENSDFKDEVVELNKTIILLRQELSEIRCKMDSRGEFMLINFGKDKFAEGPQKLNRYQGDKTETPRGFISIISDRQGVDCDVKLELDLLRRRNMELDKVLDDLKEKEFQANFFYREEHDKILDCYKNLYQVHLRKKSELENKEKQIIEENEIKDNSNNWNFGVWFLVAVLSFAGLLFLKNLFKPSII